MGMQSMDSGADHADITTSNHIHDRSICASTDLVQGGLIVFEAVRLVDHEVSPLHLPQHLQNARHTRHVNACRWLTNKQHWWFIVR
jgi:hypothetical protein